MKISYNWLQDYIKTKLPKPEKLAEILTMHAFEVEEVKKVGKDYVLDIDILPNRSHDCLSYWGVAREISAILGKDLEPLKRKKLKKEKGEIKPINLKIKCPKLVPRYSAIVVEGVKVGPSPKWLKKRIESVGLRSINNIVDLTNYVMLEMGQPLHTFDYDKIQGHSMILRESKKGERLVTLDDSSYTLDKGILVVEDKSRLIDLVGIMGGKLSETDLKTKNIILQAANFDRQTIYKAAKKLNHQTEASNIYSQGIDPNLTVPTLERAYFLLTKLGGGKIVQIIDIYPKKTLPKKIRLDLNYVGRLLGRTISKKEIIEILKSLGFKITPPIVEVPTFRLDISLAEDLIEEIGRIAGYEDIKPIFPTVSLAPQEKNFDIFWENAIKDILKEMGFSEVYNYSFFGEKEAKIFGYKSKNLIEIMNPVSVEQKYLRASLIPNLLKNIQKNQKLQLVGKSKEIRIFEIGKIFLKERFSEKKMLTGIITQTPRDGQEKFYELKGIVDSLLNKLGITDVWYDEFKPSPEQSKMNIWNPKRCAEIKVGHQEIGFLGEISGKVLVFDLDFEKLSKLVSEEREYRPVSLFPVAIRDLAILVPLDVKVADVLNVINIIGKDLIVDIDLFDIYEGTEIPDGKKNLAFHIIYQAKDRTLTSQEIDKIQNKIIKALEKNLRWQVRK